MVRLDVQVLLGDLMAKNDRIEIKCSADTRSKLEIMEAALIPQLRKKLQRKVYREDIINLILEVYNQYPWTFNTVASSKPSFK